MTGDGETPGLVNRKVETVIQSEKMSVMVMFSAAAADPNESSRTADTGVEIMSKEKPLVHLESSKMKRVGRLLAVRQG